MQPSGPNIPQITAYKTGDQTADRWQEHVRAVFNAAMRRLFNAITIAEGLASQGATGPSGPPGGTGSSTAGAPGPPGPPGSAAPINMRIGGTVSSWSYTGSSLSPVGGFDANGNLFSEVQLTTTGWPVVMGFGPPGEPQSSVSYRTGVLPAQPLLAEDWGGFIVQADPALAVDQVMNPLIVVRIVSSPSGTVRWTTLANDRSTVVPFAKFYYPQMQTIWRLPAGTHTFTLMAGVTQAPASPTGTIFVKRLAFYVMEL